MIVTPPAVEVMGGLESLALSDAGGITQFGLHLQTLAPGAETGMAHWHSAEDEFLYVLDGEAVLLPEGEVIRPGEAACFPHGDARPHALANRGALPCRFLMLGSRAMGDVCTYADGRRQVNTAKDWHIETPDGVWLKGGPLPDHLLDLSPPWGTAAAGPGTGTRRVRPGGPELATGYSHPILGGGLGDYSYQLLSDPGGLTQFGAFIEHLPPGARSSFRHWHEAEDEMVVMLDGTVVLIEEDEAPLQAGAVVAWPAGVAIGHCLENRSDAVARYLVVGTRKTRDVVHYPDHDLIAHKDGQDRAWFHADGRPR